MKPFPNAQLEVWRGEEKPCVIVSAVGPSLSGKTFWLECFASLWDGLTIAIVPNKSAFSYVGPIVDLKFMGETAHEDWPHNFRILHQRGVKAIDAMLYLAITAVNRGQPVNLVIDDMDGINSELMRSDAFYWVLRQGRHHGIRLFCSALRIIGSHTAIRSQPVQWILFRPENPTDLEFYYREFGIPKGDLLTLRPYCYIEKNPGPGSGSSLTNWVKRLPVPPRFHPTIGGSYRESRQCQKQAV
jgi:hypothetical protein